eukprot:233178_1
MPQNEFRRSRPWEHHFRCGDCKMVGTVEMGVRSLPPSHTGKPNFTWLSHCTACQKDSVLGDAPDYEPKTRGFRGPDLNRHLDVFLTDCNCPGGPWQPECEKNLQKALSSLRKEKAEFRAGKHFGSEHLILDADTINLVSGLSVENRPKFIRDLLDNWFPKRLLPHQALTESHIKCAQKLGLLLPWFDKDMARELFRKYLKFYNNQRSHSTQEMSIVLASMVCLWMPEEIPLVLETYFESILDKELTEYRPHVGLSVSCWFENVWTHHMPVVRRAPPGYIEYAWQCFAACLKLDLQFIEKSIEKGCSVEDEFDMKVNLSCTIAALISLKARCSMRDIRAATASGCQIIAVGHRMQDHYVGALKQFGLPVESSDPAVQWVREHYLAQAAERPVRSDAERKMCTDKVEQIDKWIETDDRRRKARIGEIGQAAYDAQKSAELQSDLEFSGKTLAFLDCIADFGFEKFTQTSATTFVKWFAKRTCANCARIVQIDISRKCGGCRLVSYCSKKCQKCHWETHKPDCEKSKS